ncbi:hypothetical protein PL371_17810 [Tenacibaculum maritimum]|nr:hypothetical protein [Tenacibaculum maritimum]MDB0613689.1 hypothetical protein [Tenacibaculum maritimum]
MIANYSHLSDYYKVKNRKKALRYAFEMYALSKKIKAPKDRVEAIDKILGLAQGDNIKEYALERAYLSDSIQLAKKRSRNKFVKVIYNYEEEKKLKLAARADLAETKLLAEQQKKEKLILLFVGIFSVLGFIEANTLSKEQQIVLYRLLRELLVNMKKHSKATLVVITFFKLKNSIKVQYKDNGIGAKEAVIKNGLQNMETRINSIGGSIIFETEEEKGFKSVFQFKK